MGVESSKAGEAIKNMAKELKGQERANMKPTQGQLEALHRAVKGECWLCSKSQPYRIDGTSRHLMMCEHLKDRGSIAAVRFVECPYFRLKSEEALKALER